MPTVDAPENYQPASDVAPPAPTEADKDAAVNEELAKSDDATSYVEERKEQEAAEKGEAPPRQRTSRYERLKRARDAAQREAAELRSRLEQSPDDYVIPAEEHEPSGSGVDTAESIRLEDSLQSARHMHGDAFDRAYHSFLEHVKAKGDQAAYQRVMQSDDPGAELVQWHNEQGNPSPEGYLLEAALQQGTEQQALQQQQHEVNMINATYNVRFEELAAQIPDFKETMESVRDLVQVPPVFNEMAMRSPYGPRIAYALAKEAWLPESAGLLWELEKQAGDPIWQARFFQALEDHIQMNDERRQQGGQQPHRATQAPPPMRPVTGGSATPRQDLESLAGRDDVSDYVAARRRQMRA